jgi:hypothetical protein
MLVLLFSIAERRRLMMNERLAQELIKALGQIASELRSVNKNIEELSEKLLRIEYQLESLVSLAKERREA